MIAIPRKLVHWDPDTPISDFGSPYSEGTSSDSVVSTSSLEYINSQLVAHGFTPSPGLSFDGLSNYGADKLARCLLAMLSQRVNDMSRAEDLSTKLRVLSYDNERLMGMYRSATEKTAYAEREMNVHKSRLATASKALTTSESAHKQTSAELQRARSLLIALRATHSAELRKKERDVERIIEKWSKLSDLQSKLSTVSSGLTFRGGNADVVSGSETLGKGKGYLEIALEQAESARASLTDETLGLQRLLLSIANRLQSVLYELRCLISPCDEEPAMIMHSVLFPITPSSAADDKFSTLFSSAHNVVDTISKHLSKRSQVTTQLAPDSARASDALERQRLQGIINDLNSELEEAKKLHERHVVEIQALLTHKIKSPQKSPMKPKVVGKVTSKKTRVFRRSSSFSLLPPRKIEPAYETEVIPVVIPSAAFEASGAKLSLSRSALPSAFVLPPRSPRTSLPPVEAFLPPVATTHQASSRGTLYTSTDTESASASSSDEASSSDPSTPPVPIPIIILPAPPKTSVTPVANTRRPFPLAKPLAAHMSHAYSPVKPSPLSRILMLANSPDSPDGVSEESEDSETSAVPPTVSVMKTLSSESESDDSPLREKKTEPNVGPLPLVKKMPSTESNRLTMKEKGKTRAELIIPGKLKPEKENRDKVHRKPSPSLPPAPQPKLKVSSLATSKPAPKLSSGKGGARRVLIGSAEAAPVPGWRG